MNYPISLAAAKKSYFIFIILVLGLYKIAILHFTFVFHFSEIQFVACYNYANASSIVLKALQLTTILSSTVKLVEFV